MVGYLDVLSIGRGHLRVTFDGEDEGEVERAKGIIEDMLKRGYTILVEEGTELRKVEAFDAATCEYVVREPERRGKGRKRRVPMRKVKATGIGRTAGG